MHESTMENDRLTCSALVDSEKVQNKGTATGPNRRTTTSHTSNRIMLPTIFLVIFGLTSSEANNAFISDMDSTILVDQTIWTSFVQVGEFNTSVLVSVTPQHADILQVVPSAIQLPAVAVPNETAVTEYSLCLFGKAPGKSDVVFNATPQGYVDLSSVFMRVTVMYSTEIYYISYIMGWVYFVAWSVSFYPQVYINYRRKSVVGLNFDFIALNIMGFLLYSMFNVGLYFMTEIKEEYFARHPRGVNPVQLNDVFFSLHAMFATGITIVQCCIYERGQQTISWTARSILTAFVAIVIISGSLAGASVIGWLDFLYYCSYIKLCITIIKYVPQAYMNYKRKSTVGWSIGNIFLDFVGGFLSILQMLLNAYNYNDWVSIFGDPTKFGLGMFSLIFDVFFMLQHYVFYRTTQYEEIQGQNFARTEGTSGRKDEDDDRSENLQINNPD